MGGSRINGGGEFNGGSLGYGEDDEPPRFWYEGKSGFDFEVNCQTRNVLSSKVVVKAAAAMAAAMTTGKERVQSWTSKIW